MAQNILEKSARRYSRETSREYQVRKSGPSGCNFNQKDRLAIEARRLRNEVAHAILEVNGKEVVRYHHR